MLVVDDEELVRLVIARTLRFYGFDVWEARDGLDALGQLSMAAPDLVLSDLNMPRCNGERLCDELKRHPETAGIRVVLMTGGPLDEARMRQLGCDAVVYKPLPDRLGELLLAVLSDAAPPSRPGGWAVPGRGPARQPPAA
ncbi:MAG: response regulator [Vicinamibacteraceae bacterium]